VRAPSSARVKSGAEELGYSFFCFSLLNSPRALGHVFFCYSLLKIVSKRWHEVVSLSSFEYAQNCSVNEDLRKDVFRRHQIQMFRQVWSVPTRRVLGSTGTIQQPGVPGHHPCRMAPTLALRILLRSARHEGANLVARDNFGCLSLLTNTRFVILPIINVDCLPFTASSLASLRPHRHRRQSFVLRQEKLVESSKAQIPLGRPYP
jgi:hypothetical protein